MIYCEGEWPCNYWQSYKTKYAFISFMVLKNIHPDKMITPKLSNKCLTKDTNSNIKVNE